MTTAAVLTGYALLTGTAAPYLLARARWLHRAPAAAITAWLGLAATFVVSGALACYHLLLTEPHVHDGLVGLLTACGLVTGGPARGAPPTPVDLAAVLLPAALVLLPAVCLTRISWRAHRTRRRQRDMLALVGTPSPRYGATIVEHEVPAVYCLPGRAPRIVVTSGALRALSDEQLRAVLAHEDAHIKGRHHLVHAAVAAFARAFPFLPLARLAQEQTALLLEMAADDRRCAAIRERRSPRPCTRSRPARPRTSPWARAAPARSSACAASWTHPRSPAARQPRRSSWPRPRPPAAPADRLRPAALTPGGAASDLDHADAGAAQHDEVFGVRRQDSHG